MKFEKVIAGFFFILALSFFAACRHDKYETTPVSNACYPPEVDAIITKKCATSGCHNSASKSGNLDFSTFEHLLEGNNIGATLIPFRTDQSTLLFFTNTDTLLGPKLNPTMPINNPPLSRQEYLTLKNWIASGSPDCKGTVPFSGNPNRKKFYVVNQGCDLLAVFDSEKGVLMRYINLGVLPGVSESPHDIKVTPDGNYFLVVFLNSDFVQMYRTSDDSLVANIPVGSGISGNWNTLAIASDSKKAYIVDYSLGRIANIDLITKTCNMINLGVQSLHGITLNATDDTLLLTEDLGSRIFTVPVNDPSNYDERDVSQLRPGVGILGIHRIDFTPDQSKYFITCDIASQVWVFDAHTNALLDTFHVGSKPLEMAFSETTGNLFITCQEATVFNNVIGAVEVINYNTLSHVKTIQVGWQPHGVKVDDAKGLAYVLNRNVNPNGPAPHHTTTCGRNGSLNIIDLNTLQTLPLAPELSSDPYELTIRK